MARSMAEVSEPIHRDTSEIADRWLEAAKEEPWFALPVHRAELEETGHWTERVERLGDASLLHTRSGRHPLIDEYGAGQFEPSPTG